MKAINVAVVLSLFLVSTAVGGAVARLAFLVNQLQSMLVILLVTVVLVAVGVAAAKSGRWLANPYW